ncbi:cuticle protein 16.5 [Drosophila erecta]|uniref:GG22235 n=1 Tax=Drosophila erecta TaxID=7220 RepID=B3P3E0_DROER|nr:cuticle protein 16.5 [Drosophila erecta]EDV48720.1 uncharacterized protein Dere_GG22235 [Drosophila erecta]
MAAHYIVIFSAILVLAQGSNLFQETEVPIHSGAPVASISQGHPSVSQSVGHGALQLPVPIGGGNQGVGLGLAGARPYVPAPRPAVTYARPAVSYSRPAVSYSRPAVSYARPAAAVVPSVVGAPVASIRQPYGVPAPVAVGAGRGNGYHGCLNG